MAFHDLTLAQSLDAPLAQSHAFEAALTHIGRPPLRLNVPGCRDMLILRRRLGPMKVGLVSRADLSRHAVHDVAAKADVDALILNAETARGGYGLRMMTASSVAQLNIARTEEDIRKGMHQKWRNRLNRAEAQRLRITQGFLPRSRDHWLLDADQAQGKAKGYRNWPVALTRAFAVANNSSARIFEARLNGRIVGAMLFLCHGAVATYHIGWSNDEGRMCGAHHALMWRAVCDLRQQGIGRLDLGAVATDTAPGLARFKLGLGAGTQTLGGTWLAVPGLMRKRLPMRGSLGAKKKAASVSTRGL